MNKEKTVVKVYALILVTMILTITLGFMGVKLSEAQKRLEALEKDTNESFLDQQAQIDSLQIDYESLASSTDALTQHVENLGKDLQETKQIQKNTNSALTRLRKQKEELEKRLEEAGQVLEECYSQHMSGQELRVLMAIGRLRDTR